MTIAFQADEARNRAVPDPARWRESAACRYFDPELFFPLSTTGRGAADAAQAKAVCAHCPVRRACLDFALATGQEFGIWGGCDERELRLLRRQRRAGLRQLHPPLAPAPPACGSAPPWTASSRSAKPGSVLREYD